MRKNQKHIREDMFRTVELCKESNLTQKEFCKKKGLAYGTFKYWHKKSITLLNCMAHVRRGFEKALEYDKSKAEYAMGEFQKLYAIEQKARETNLNPEQRHELRLDEALPILNKLGKWIVETYKSALPKSAIGKATAYCIPRWDKLIAYLNDGSLEIDNNFAENAIRLIAIGRKNYLFAGSHRGAERAAMFYSFFGTCKKDVEYDIVQFFRITNNTNVTIDSITVCDRNSGYGAIPQIDTALLFSINNHILPFDTTEYTECVNARNVLIIHANVGNNKYSDEIEWPFAIIDPLNPLKYPKGSFNIIINECDTINNYFNVTLIEE